MKLPQDNNIPQGTSAVNKTDDRDLQPKFWIAAYTRPRSEKKVAEALTKAKIETYLPIQTLERQWSDRKKKVDMVVIPMIIFARISKDELLTVKQDHRVIRVLSYPGHREPAIIPDYQIRNLRLMLTNADTPVEFLPQPIALSDTVRVKSGHLQGLIGKVKRIDSTKTKLIVSIDLLGGAMVEIETTNLEIVPKNSPDVTLATPKLGE